MGMFDTIAGNQVKCFHCELINYEVGDVVPSFDFKYGSSYIILPFVLNYHHSWDNGNYIFIKDSRVCKIKKLSELIDDDFNSLDTVITYYGDIVNIKSIDDIKSLVKDMFNIKLEHDFAIMFHYEDYWTGKYTDEIERKFKTKWLSN